METMNRIRFMELFIQPNFFSRINRIINDKVEVITVADPIIPYILSNSLDTPIFIISIIIYKICHLFIQII